EQVIWWEEKNGQRVSPVIVTSGKNPFDAQNTVRIPGKKPEVIVEQPINRNGMPVVLDCTNQSIVEAKPKLGERLAGLLRGNSNTVKCGEVTVVSDKAVSDKSASDKIASDKVAKDKTSDSNSTQSSKTLTNADLAAGDRNSSKKEAATSMPGKSLV